MMQPQSETAIDRTNSEPNSEPIIVAEQVEKWYDNNFHVLRGVSLTVNRGEVVVVMGPSGSGKSTFIRTFNALETYQKGRIAIDGISLTVGTVSAGKFWLHIIPETLQITTLGQRQVGDWLNIEIDQQTMTIVDTVTRTVEKMLAERGMTALTAVNAKTG